MDKSPDAFRSIGEVSRLVGVAPHVLRYWESQFTQLSPVKRGDGRRYYRPDDVRLVAGLCQVLREEGLSIRGAKRVITADRGAALRQIGAVRLGESMGGAIGEKQSNPPGPAVRLAAPDLQPMAGQSADAHPHTHDAEIGQAGDAPAAPRRPKPESRKPDSRKPDPRKPDSRKPAPRSIDALPLFPDLDRISADAWLARLSGTAIELRRQVLARSMPPAGAQALRDALVSSR